MKVEVKAMSIVCDCCGETFYDSDDFCCYVGDKDGSMILNSAMDSDWLCIGDKDYCPDCYYLNDEDHYVCKDGRVYDYETKELLTNEIDQQTEREEYHEVQALPARK